MLALRTVGDLIGALSSAAPDTSLEVVENNGDAVAEFSLVDVDVRPSVVTLGVTLDAVPLDGEILDFLQEIADGRTRHSKRAKELLDTL